MHQSKNYDAVIIGSGQGGTPLSVTLAQAGWHTALVEREHVGGTCVNEGCTPTKTMVASGRVAYLARRASDYGVHTGPIRVDLGRVRQRKRDIVTSFRNGSQGRIEQAANLELIFGEASFTGPKSLQVRVKDGAQRELAAAQIFINTGTRSSIPAIEGLSSVPFLDNKSIMELGEVPEHLLVLGGGYIGLEFGQMFRRFGSEVTIVETAPRLIHREDEDVSVAIHDILEAEGVHIRLNATCIRVAKRDGGIAVGVDCTNGAPEVFGSHLLLAVGRRPNTDDLGLDKAGIIQDKRGYIVVDDELRTNVPGIWALGDCNGRGAFTHTSYNDFEIVAANILDSDSRRLSDRITAYALYIDPPLGRAGMTETEVRATGRKAFIGTRPMTRVGRAIEKGETQGFIKILVDADSKQILGASILGTSGDEAIHTILDVMYARAPYTVMQRAVHIHPTVSELLPTVLGELKPLGSEIGAHGA
jgi:pyruvate/2-oxoglutarate dehydrogenase complex dihydrolipoamide dehydrogenase (E3) component